MQRFCAGEYMQAFARNTNEFDVSGSKRAELKPAVVEADADAFRVDGVGCKDRHYIQRTEHGP